MNVQKSSCTVSVTLIRFSLHLNLLNRFSKNHQVSHSIKIRPIGAELFHADERTNGRTDRYDKTKNHFSQFC